MALVVTVKGVGSLGIGFNVTNTCMCALARAAVPTGRVSIENPEVQLDVGYVLVSANDVEFTVIQIGDRSDGAWVRCRAEILTALRNTQLRAVYLKERVDLSAALSDEAIADAMVAQYDSDGDGSIGGEERVHFLRLMLASNIATVTSLPRPLTLVFKRPPKKPRKSQGKPPPPPPSAAAGNSAASEGGRSSTLCSVCAEPIRPSDRALSMNKRPLHLTCCVCVDCNFELASGERRATRAADGSLVCVPCEQLRRGEVCAACREPLGAQFVRAAGSKFHAACFTCTACGGNLAAQGACVEDTATGKPYCRPCLALRTAIAEEKGAAERAVKATTQAASKAKSDAEAEYLAMAAKRRRKASRKAKKKKKAEVDEEPRAKPLLAQRRSTEDRLSHASAAAMEARKAAKKLSLHKVPTFKAFAAGSRRSWEAEEPPGSPRPPKKSEEQAAAKEQALAELLINAAALFAALDLLGHGTLDATRSDARFAGPAAAVFSDIIQGADRDGTGVVGRAAWLDHIARIAAENGAADALAMMQKLNNELKPTQPAPGNRRRRLSATVHAMPAPPPPPLAVLPAPPGQNDQGTPRSSARPSVGPPPPSPLSGRPPPTPRTPQTMSTLQLSPRGAHATCARCNNALEAKHPGTVHARGAHFHAACYTCTSCDVRLDSGRALSVGGSRPSELFAPGEAFCAPCFAAHANAARRGTVPGRAPSLSASAGAQHEGATEKALAPLRAAERTVAPVAPAALAAALERNNVEQQQLLHATLTDANAALAAENSALAAQVAQYATQLKRTRERASERARTADEAAAVPEQPATRVGPTVGAARPAVSRDGEVKNDAKYALLREELAAANAARAADAATAAAALQRAERRHEAELLAVQRATAARVQEQSSAANDLLKQVNGTLDSAVPAFVALDAVAPGEAGEVATGVASAGAVAGATVRSVARGGEARSAALSPVARAASDAAQRARAELVRIEQAHVARQLASAAHDPAARSGASVPWLDNAGTAQHELRCLGEELARTWQCLAQYRSDVALAVSPGGHG